MENRPFDELSKRLSTVRVTRTSALRGLVGGVAALVGAVALETAEAKKKGKHHKGDSKGDRGHVSKQVGPYPNSVTYRGQGLEADGFGNYDLQTEICGIANGADADGPYLLWVLTATGANNAEITGPWGTAAMTKFGNGTFKYVSGWYEPSTLPGNVSATYDGRARNAQLVISHGCRPFTELVKAWCSPGFWRNSIDDGGWTLVGPAITPTSLFNGNVSTAFYGNDLGTLPDLSTVLTTSGNTYKGPAVSGTDPRTQSPNQALSPFNATGAYLTDHIPGYTFDPALIAAEAGGSDTCPIDNSGDYKCCDPQQGIPCPPAVTCP